MGTNTLQLTFEHTDVFTVGNFDGYFCSLATGESATPPAMDVWYSCTHEFETFPTVE